jgi:hypothetical protein
MDGGVMPKRRDKDDLTDAEVDAKIDIARAAAQAMFKTVNELHGSQIDTALFMEALATMVATTVYLECEDDVDKAVALFRWMGDRCANLYEHYDEHRAVTWLDNIH